MSTRGTLYLVATPIGNLEDLSPRALRSLREAALVAAEDTRVTRKLLAHFGVHTPLISYHAHSGPARREAILQRLRDGADVALVSDAGTPGLSDPGGALVARAVAEGIAVTPVPGPCAAVAALCAAGLDPARVVFQGFLPRGRAARRRAVEPLRTLPHTLVFYEAPGRVAVTLAFLAEALGDRRAVVAREITKRFEEFARGTLAGLADRLGAEPPRGECVIVVEGAAPVEAPREGELDARLQALLARGLTPREAAREAAREGTPRREAYRRALLLRAEQR